MQDDFEHDDDHDDDTTLPPGAAFFYLMPLALVFWGVLIWAVLK